MENMENMGTQVEQETVDSDYEKSYAPKVHVIGRSTMLIALVLSYLPVGYLIFVKGYGLPVVSYITVAATIASIFVGPWIAEPFTWFPILGAASLYMGYFSGNVSNIRVPVARMVQKNYGVQALTTRGQIVTTIATAVSVYVNLTILTLIVLLGNWIMPHLPAVVLNAFNYVIPALVGAMVSLLLDSYGLMKTLRWSIPAVIAFILTRLVPDLAMFGTTITVAIAVLVAYVLFRREGKKEKEQEAES